jgi:ABC-type glycerol-3-phosphate transport system permease component
MRKRSRKAIFWKSLQYLLVSVGAVVMFIPFMWMVSTAFKEYAYVIEFPPRLIPTHPSINNFITAWGANNFQLYFKNSVLVSSSSLVLSVTISSMMAYAFARFKFPGKEYLFYLVLLVLMVPNLINIIPQFMLAKTFHLRNSLTGLVIFYVAGSLPLNTFLLRGFFESLPKELEEAMLIDGGSFLTIFARLVLPYLNPPWRLSRSFHCLVSGMNSSWRLHLSIFPPSEPCRLPLLPTRASTAPTGGWCSQLH